MEAEEVEIKNMMKQGVLRQVIAPKYASLVRSKFTYKCKPDKD